MRFSLTALLFLLVSSAFAQKEAEIPVTEEKAKKEILTAEQIKEATNRKKDRLVVDYSFDNWFHQETNGFATNFKSKGFALYFMYDYQLGNSNFSIAPGIGFATSHIHHNSKVNDLDSAVVMVPNPNDTLTKRNKFVLNSLEIPLELRFRTKPNNKGQSFKISAGVRFGVRVGAATKQKFTNAFNETKVVKEKKFDDTQIIKFGPTVRLGYGPFNIFAYYNLIPVFKNNRGMDANQISIGISLNGM